MKDEIIYVLTCQEKYTRKYKISFPKVDIVTVQEVFDFLYTQWVKDPSVEEFLQVPVENFLFTCNGWKLRFSGTLGHYNISHNGTMYLRCTDFGRITVTAALSYFELRKELRDMEVKGFHGKEPAWLMDKVDTTKLSNTRLKRLTMAMKQNDHGAVEKITKEGKSKSLQKHSKVPTGTLGRQVYLSITELERKFHEIEMTILGNCILIFDADRSWVLDIDAPSNGNAGYKMHFSDDFLEFLVWKEEKLHLHWFRPTKSYEAISTFLCSISDPTNNHQLYRELILDPKRWYTLLATDKKGQGWHGNMSLLPKVISKRLAIDSKKPRYTKSIGRILFNIESSSFDIVAVQELLYQSNCTLKLRQLKN